MRKRSFTLVEVMIALIIGSIGIITLFSSMSASRLAQVSINRRVAANKIITAKLEEMSQIAYKDLAEFYEVYPNGFKVEQIPASHWPVDPLSKDKNYTANLNVRYSLLYTLVQIYPEYCDIRVYVYWLEPDHTNPAGHTGLIEWANILKYRDE